MYLMTSSTHRSGYRSWRHWRVDRIDFGYLCELVEVSDSLLSKHMTILENAGYTEVIKGYHGKRPRTWYSLTDTGRTAYLEYLAALNEIIGKAP
jgi:hypothetical protein